MLQSETIGLSVNLPALTSYLLATNKSLYSRLDTTEWQDLSSTITEFIDISGYQYDLDKAYDAGFEDARYEMYDDAYDEGYREGYTQAESDFRDA